MATEPNQLPEWADQDTTIDGEPNVLEPPQNKKDFGWGEEIPGVQYQNWWQRLVYRWIEFFRDQATVVSSVEPPVGSAGKQWFKLDAGTIQWQHTLHSDGVDGLAHGDGRVYSISSDGFVIAANDSNGSSVWQNEIAPTEFESMNAVDFRGGQVFTAGSTITVYALDASDGSEVWTHDHNLNAVVDVKTDASAVYSCDIGDNVVSAAIGDGSENWTHTEHTDQPNSIALTADLVLTAGYDGLLVAANKNDGSIAWTEDYSSEFSNGLNLVAFGDGRIYISARVNETIRALDPSDRSVIWEYAHSETVVNNLVFFDGRVHITDSAGNLTVINAENGEVLWSSQPTQDSVGGLAIDGNDIYYASSDTVYELEGGVPAHYVSDGTDWIRVSYIDGLN